MTSELDQDSILQQGYSTEVVLQTVVRGTASVTGKDFFPALVKHLALALDAQNCLVSEVSDDGQLHTLGFCRNGELEPNITYSPVAGPCEITLSQNLYYCPHGVQESFPHHPALPALEAESYVGVCLQNTEGKVLGNLVVLDSKPLLHHQLHESILKIFAARAAAELERQRVTTNLRQLNEDLESRVEQRTVALQQALQNLKHTQTQLVHSEKMSSLGQLVAGIAHEINNPVSFICGNLNYVEDYTQSLLQLVRIYQDALPNPPAAVQQAIATCDLDFISQDLPCLLNSMKAGSKRIRELVLSFRNFSRLDEAYKKVVNVHEGIDNTLILLSQQLNSSSERPAIRVIKQYGNIPAIECCAGQLNQVFMNILVNAIDAFNTNPEHQETEPCIKIRTAVKEGSIEIHIADNGPGIAENIQHKIFEPFFTTKEVGRGTGLGLAISYQLVVEQHKGKLYCQSIAGQGARFTIELPRT